MAHGSRNVLQPGGIQGGGHDDELEVRSRGLLQIEGTREGDIAIQMALVEFVEENGGDVGELRVLEQLPENTLSVTKRIRVLSDTTRSKRI